MRIVWLTLILIATFLSYAPEAKTEETPQKSLARGCATGDVKLITEAIKNGANVNEGFAMLMPLYLATNSNHLTAVTLLIEKGADIDHLNGPAGRSALHQAAIRGYFDILKFLVESRANINIRNTHGRTPLDYAIAAKKANAYDAARADLIINYLIKNGGLSGNANAPKDEKVTNKPGISSDMSILFGEHWKLTLILSAIFTWVLGLIPSLLIRFVFLKRPLSKRAALLVAALFWFLHFTLAIALKTTPKSHSALLLVAVVSYFILRKSKRSESN